MSNNTTPIRATMQLRAILRALRKQHNMTQAELGRAIGVSQKRIARIESNPSLVSVEQLFRVISALGGVLHLETPPRIIYAETRGTMSMGGVAHAAVIKQGIPKPAHKKPAKSSPITKPGSNHFEAGGGAGW